MGKFIIVDIRLARSTRSAHGAHQFSGLLSNGPTRKNRPSDLNLYSPNSPGAVHGLGPSRVTYITLRNDCKFEVKVFWVRVYTYFLGHGLVNFYDMRFRCMRTYRPAPLPCSTTYVRT